VVFGIHIAVTPNGVRIDRCLAAIIRDDPSKRRMLTQCAFYHSHCRHSEWRSDRQVSCYFFVRHYPLGGELLTPIHPPTAFETHVLAVPFETFPQFVVPLRRCHYTPRSVDRTDRQNLRYRLLDRLHLRQTKH
jgi:hypothetical protein